MTKSPTLESPPEEAEDGRVTRARDLREARREQLLEAGRRVFAQRGYHAAAISDIIDAADVTVFPAADASTHAVRIRVQLPALDVPPQPGLTAKVAFPAVKGAAFPRAPTSALVRRGEVTAVYVLSDGRLSLRQVRLGDAAGDQVDVISGLKPGEMIATDPVAAQQALVAARKDD